MAVGILLALVGLWVVMRTVNRDSSGRTLVDRVLSRHPEPEGAK
jgi:hypothetical protein